MAATIRLSQQHSCSFDHLVGELLDMQRQVEAERLGSPKIDDKIEFGRLLHRQIARLLALENAANIDAGLMALMGKTASVTHQAAGHDVLAKSVNRGQCMALRPASRA